MYFASICVLTVVTFMVVIYWTVLACFLYAVRFSHKETSVQKDFTPKAAVLLALRGADPFLGKCIEGLLAQDYPDYSLFLLFDNESDPAVEPVRKILAQYPDNKVYFKFFTEYMGTCTLKVNSLCCILKELENTDYEVFVTVDADTLTRKDWLRTLVSPLRDPQYALSTGLRWYLPPNNSGSIIRHLWNMGAVNQQVFVRIPWGGSMALRKDILKNGYLYETWSNALADDVSLDIVLRKLGKKCRVVSSLMMVNHERCNVLSFYPWMRRQVLSAQKYHRYFGLVSLQAIVTVLPIFWAIFSFSAGIIQNDLYLLLNALYVLLIWFVGVGIAFLVMHHAVCRFLRSRGEAIPHASFGFLLKCCCLIPFTQILYFVASIAVFFVKEVAWRGIQYKLLKDGKVQMVQYVPYSQIQPKDAGEVSL